MGDGIFYTRLGNGVRLNHAQVISHDLNFLGIQLNNAAYRSGQECHHENHHQQGCTAAGPLVGSTGSPTGSPWRNNLFMIQQT
jgi:hypothetical protein